MTDLLEAIEKAAAIINRPPTVQFFHDQSNGITYAVDVNFDKEDILETVHNFNKPTVVRIGMSYVHPNDVYNKKTGRDLSVYRLAPVELKLSAIDIKEEKIFLYFNGPEIALKFRVNTKSDKPHLLEVNPGYTSILVRDTKYMSFHDHY